MDHRVTVTRRPVTLRHRCGHVEDLEVEDPELADFGYEITEHRIYKWIVPWEPEEPEPEAAP
ncbi:MAG: hypothetical protein D6766_08365 [Verrucomicrobia bacterium]|nr:MAG: hypothetical protein D6766_08365 [Verrucomicrobiota bacterium]